MRALAGVALGALLVACGGGGVVGGDGGVPGDDGGTAATDGGQAGTDGGTPSCPAGIVCVDHLPFRATGDTSTLPPGILDHYACAPATDESGPEQVYRVQLSANAFLSAAVHDGAGVDVDVHLLSALDPSACLDRGDHDARADVAAGIYYVVVDTFVSGGTVHSGPYEVDIGALEPSVGPCEMQTGTLPRVGDGGNHLAMPATGPVVEEAHLVTQDEPAPYPTTATENLERHYRLSEDTTGLVMYRTQPWAPLEGGSYYGAGIWPASYLPTLDEGWYLNMYWTASARPPRGTRMIVRDPSGGPRAVVVAAGYETGPGNLAHIAGVPEEVHFYLGTTHLDPLTVGLAVDPSLPLGPRVCTSP